MAGDRLAQDKPHAYIGRLRRAARHPDVDEYLLNRLLVFGLIEARACERLSLLVQAFEEPQLKQFYAQLERSEARHYRLYLELARRTFAEDRIQARLDEFLDIEAKLVKELPLRPALH